MRFLRFADFVRSANVATVMSDIATFTIPRGMVYSFSTRMNLHIFLQEYLVQNGAGGTTAAQLLNQPVQCVDLGGSEVDCADQKNQIVAFVNGVNVNTATNWVVSFAAGTLTPDTDIFATGTLNLQIIANSAFDLDPTVARAAGAHEGVLEIRAEAPAGQDIGISIFSGGLEQIQKNTQVDMNVPLKLAGAVLLPEGFVLAVKMLAPGVTHDGSAVLHTVGTKIADDPDCAEALCIPYHRFALKNFPSNFKERVLVSMSTS